ncbi:MAG TPA: hypothetical protein EYH54_03490 [Nautiliaceae bacterium]|nr:hypothetical protein [Nautiliaceae bacterium]
MKRRKKYIKYLLTSAIFFYLTFLYLAYLRKDYNAFVIIVVHFFLFFAVYYMSYILHQIGKEINNFLIKTLAYLSFYLVIFILLSPMALLASFAGYLLSNDNYFEELQEKIKNYFK